MIKRLQYVRECHNNTYLDVNLQKFYMTRQHICTQHIKMFIASFNLNIFH